MRRISFLFIFARQKDTASWLAACSWLMAHPAHRTERSSQLAPLPLITRATAVRFSSKHTHSHYQHTHTRPHERSRPAATASWLHLKAQSGAKPPNNASLLHYALPQVVVAFALFSEVTSEVSALHAIIMDCLFLLIWTLPVPPVGCSRVKFLSTFLTWSIVKACRQELFSSPLFSGRANLERRQTNIITIIIYFILFHFSAAASHWLSFIVLKSDAKLNSSVKLTLQQGNFTHHLFMVSSFQLWSQPVATCPLMAFSLLFLQTLHIYCTHASHSATASYSSSHSHGLNYGECLSFDISGCCVPAGTVPRL